MSRLFPHLFTPFELGPLGVRNRIFIPGHATALSDNSQVSEDLIAYHECRAANGVGLIITEVNVVHESAVYSPKFLSVASDDCIAGHKRLAESVHAHGCGILAQLYHPGRSLRSSLDGSLLAAYAPSEVPDEIFRVSPRPLPIKMIWEIIDSYASAAERMVKAGMDGVEIVASHGYLISQFLNGRHNLRDDEFGGDFQRRLRFVREVIARCRDAVGPEKVVGIRISADEKDHSGLRPSETIRILRALDVDGVLDYFNLAAGSVETVSGWVHIVPPMSSEAGYVEPLAASVKSEVSTPVMVTGRINTPHIAERIIAEGSADMCGLVRAHIADPDFTKKAFEDRTEDIRACVACDQACIGHIMGYNPVSCIQYPETGRERRFANKKAVSSPRVVWVIGGGPAGMKAAAVSAQRGHRVKLFERAARLGGQVLLAQMLPGRSEFGGIATNLEHEVRQQGVEIIKNTDIGISRILDANPDVVILATGAEPRGDIVEGQQEAHVVESWDVIRDQANVGANVVVADWRCDWVGMGVAEKLVRAGCHVRLAVNGLSPGESVNMLVRDDWLGTLHRLGVEIVPNVRLAGVDADSVYFAHRASGEPVICEQVDTLVLAAGHRRVCALETSLEKSEFAGPVFPIGDCLAPRTCEEAVLEGLKVAMSL